MRLGAFQPFFTMLLVDADPERKRTLGNAEFARDQGHRVALFQSQMDSFATEFKRVNRLPPRKPPRGLRVLLLTF